MLKRLATALYVCGLLVLSGCSKPPSFEVEGEVIGDDGIRSYQFQTAGGMTIESVTIEFVALDPKGKETSTRYQTELKDLGLFKFNEKLPAGKYGVIVVSTIKGKSIEKMSMASAKDREKAKAAVSAESRKFLINTATQSVTQIQ
jgi:hypothetical protein